MGKKSSTSSCGRRRDVLRLSMLFQGGQYFYGADFVWRFWRQGSLNVRAPFFVHHCDPMEASFWDEGDDFSGQHIAVRRTNSHAALHLAARGPHVAWPLVVGLPRPADRVPL